MNSKTIAFIAMMGALGNALFLLSYYLGQISPGIAFDFALVGVFIAGFFGGPSIGFMAGLFAGVFPGIYFGPLGNGSWLGLIGLPIGKALTGLTAGLLCRGLNMDKRASKSLLTIPLAIVSYVPEFLFTIAYFASLLPYFIGGGGFGVLLIIMPKAWAEVIIISFLMAALVGNQGFHNFVNTFFTSSMENKGASVARVRR